MFGQVGGVFATDDQIYVVDRQLPRVRRYTLDGEYLGDLGGEGQGPGEYAAPGIVVGDGAGRMFVQAPRTRRFNVYSEDGGVLDTWAAPRFVCCAFPMVAAPEGLLWTIVSDVDIETDEPRMGVQLHGLDGPVGPVRLPREIPFERSQHDIEFFNGVTEPGDTPFAPRFIWNIAASGAIVAGASDRYRFEIQDADGPTRVVERFWEPVAVGPEEAEWQRLVHIKGLRRYTASADWTWDGAEMPATKPAFFELVPTPGGDVWVVREGPSERVADCLEDPLEATLEAARAAPCWRPRWVLDAFDGEGRYLGEIENFDYVWPAAATTYVRGDMVVAATEDEAGTIRVKRYRLAIPVSQGR